MLDENFHIANGGLPGFMELNREESGSESSWWGSKPENTWLTCIKPESSVYRDLNDVVIIFWMAAGDKAMHYISPARVALELVILWIGTHIWTLVLNFLKQVVNEN